MKRMMRQPGGLTVACDDCYVCHFPTFVVMKVIVALRDSVIGGLANEYDRVSSGGLLCVL
jgi:hypothetical protein